MVPASTGPRLRTLVYTTHRGARQARSLPRLAEPTANSEPKVEEPVIMTDAREIAHAYNDRRSRPAIKFVLACYGMRGDVENSVVVGRELLRRGHDVHIAIPPNLVGFAEAAGLAAVAYGLDSRALSELQRNYWGCFFSKPWRIQLSGQVRARNFRSSSTDAGRRKAITTPTSLADGIYSNPSPVLGFEQFAAQRRGVLRPAVRHAGICSPMRAKRPAPVIPAGAVGPARDDGL